MKNHWVKWGVRILGRIALIYVLVCVAMFFLQRGMIFYPGPVDPTTTLSPWVVNEQVIGFHRRVENPDAVWLLMHGNAGDASGRGYVLRAMSEQDSLYVLQYPGYGDRKGTPSKREFNTAASEAYGMLRASYPGIPICVAGESIGSGPASFLSQAPVPPDQITLVVPFDRLEHVASGQFPFLPVSLLLLDRWDNVSALKEYQGPLQIFGAEQDRVIPIMHAKILADATGAEFTMIPGGHNEWSFSPYVRFQHTKTSSVLKD